MMEFVIHLEGENGSPCLVIGDQAWYITKTRSGMGNLKAYWREELPGADKHPSDESHNETIS